MLFLSLGLTLVQLEAELKESGESVLAGHKNTFFQVYDMVSVLLPCLTLPITSHLSLANVLQVTKRLVERSAWQTVDLSKLFSVIG